MNFILNTLLLYCSDHRQKRLRLERGKLLLARGLPVSEVALAVGFFDQSHFHHGFRQAFGLTPADYRQQMLPS